MVVGAEPTKKPTGLAGFEMAEREGLTPLHFIPLRLCGVRFAEGMIFSLAPNRQSNPVLRKGFSSP